MSKAEVQNLLLSGICGKCKRHFTVFVEDMPRYAIVSEDAGGEQWTLRLAEHVIFLCPYCGCLINAGNGSRRETKDEV